MTTTPAQPEPSEREALAIADALRSEADVSGRPGQWMALNRLADRVAALAARPAPVVSAAAREEIARALVFSDAEWREYQAIPDQGYSHRAWLDARAARIVKEDR